MASAASDCQSIIWGWAVAHLKTLEIQSPKAVDQAKPVVSGQIATQGPPIATKANMTLIYTHPRGQKGMPGDTSKASKKVDVLGLRWLLDLRRSKPWVLLVPKEKDPPPKSGKWSSGVICPKNTSANPPVEAMVVT